MTLCECCQVKKATMILMIRGYFEPSVIHHLCASCYPEVKDFQSKKYKRQFGVKYDGKTV